MVLEQKIYVQRFLTVMVLDFPAVCYCLVVFGIKVRFVTKPYAFTCDLNKKWRRLQQLPYGSGSCLYGTTAVHLKGDFYTFGGLSDHNLKIFA